MRLIFKILNLIFMFNFLFFKKINNLLTINNLINYNNILCNKYKIFFTFFLNYPQLNKYNWVVNSTIFMKFINVNFINVFPAENFFRKSLNFSDTLNNIIFIKKKSSMLKKNSDYEFNILNYSAKTRDNYYYNNELNVIDENFGDFQNDLTNNSYQEIMGTNFFSSFKIEEKKILNKFSTNLNLKTLDLNKKINLIFVKNRVLLRKFLKVKFKRKNTFSRYLKNFIKLKPLDFLFNFEYRLTNLLTRSLFFFNYRDCVWFLKNGYISVNGFVEYNQKRVIKPFEIVNITFNDYYFFYYRYMIDNCLTNLYKFNLKIWKINNSRNIKTEKKKKTVENYSDWIYKYIYYKNDVPKFIEVDYISMSMVLLNYSFNINFVDFYNIKFLNLYLNRLYNWKTII